MNRANTYIVQCNRENFDDIKHLVQLFSNIIDIDKDSNIIKTLSLDSITKQRLTELGVGFWEETESYIKSAAI